MMRLFLRCAAVGALSLAAQAADFSYYMLSLAWAPNYCSQPAGSKDPRHCGPGQRLGFVVHGLRPMTAQGTAPAACAVAKPVPADVVQSMLPYIPSESLVRSVWRSYGFCSGLGVSEYFALTRQLRDSIRIPAGLDDLRQPVRMQPQNLGTAFAEANPGIPRAGIRVSCSAGGLLEEVRICFDRKGIAQACEGVGECTRLAVGLSPMQPPKIR